METLTAEDSCSVKDSMTPCICSVNNKEATSIFLISRFAPSDIFLSLATVRKISSNKQQVSSVSTWATLIKAVIRLVATPERSANL